MEASEISTNYETAKALHRAGRLAEAEALYRVILAAEPTHPDTLHMMGVLALQSGQASAALLPLERAVALHSQNPAFHTTLGQARLHLGQLEAALGSFRTATELQVDFVAAYSLAGLVLRQMGRNDEARVALEKALALEPNLVAALFHLGAILDEQGNRTGAIDCYRRALALAPDFAEAELNLGICLAQVDDVAEALPHLERAAVLRPDLADAHGALGNALLESGQGERAIAAYRRALEIEPKSALVLFNLGNAFRAEGRFEAALMTYREALASDPRLSQAAINAGGVFDDLHRYAEAEQCYRQALAIDPNAALAHAGLSLVQRAQGATGEALSEAERSVALDAQLPETHTAVGLCQQTLGKFDAAAAAFRRALAIDPLQPAALVQLAVMRGVELSEAERTQIERALTKPKLRLKDKASLHFAMGTVADGRGAYDEAFGHYAKANAIKAGMHHYDPIQIERHVDALIETFDRAFFEVRRDFGVPSEQPIFVLGMPRSGTTLVEQILASHPGVHGGGELSAADQWITGLDLLPTIREARMEYPKSTRILDRSAAERLAGRYLDEIGREAGAALRITDKLPANFLRIGLIALLLPRARIIHCMRDPLDTCLSCYFQNFAEPMPFTNTLDRLGRYYRAYERLMAHWRSVLPQRMLEVSYEELVAEPDRWCRQILAHCALPWDEGVLRFFATDRSIRTASVWQVRQPIYLSSVGRWKHYRDHLAPLLNALGRDANAESGPNAAA
ncbi:MAG TPA: sulfotransferase [Alphaproteobacteria bacterium]|nr:sulfotransferase [Alphaproteobacteria bacterium]